MNWLLIASRERTGSNMLATGLASVPGMARIGGEPFHPIDGNEQHPCWPGDCDPADWLHGHANPTAECCFLVIHASHRELRPSILSSLRGLITHVIVLYRRDTLSQLRSWKAAYTSGLWSSMPGDQRPSHLPEATPDEWRLWDAAQVGSVAYDRTYWHDRPLMVLPYERMVKDWSSVTAGVSRLVNVDCSTALPATTRNTYL